MKTKDLEEQVGIQDQATHLMVLLLNNNKTLNNPIQTYVHFYSTYQSLFPCQI